MEDNIYIRMNKCNIAKTERKEKEMYERAGELEIDINFIWQKIKPYFEIHWIIIN